ncbi:sodium/shloride dependent amino acid transporter [Anopheles darlingi]|uniref:Sodium-dependent nutrient amino acid transporter 1 n=1 Tax=Anopheles darlingi TaxID=43151 RepID=W5JJJ9_ANODA|nr:sodium/shloride dependent amino acid transporter [Anopheles darlingi]
MENGGGAFLIPYLIVLLLVGRPIYYLEMVMGQFSSRGCVKVFDLAPLMRGVGIAQTLSLVVILGYYAAILAIAVRYFIASFFDPLPWVRCEPLWDGCVDSDFRGHVVNGSVRPSAEFYFNRNIMHSHKTLDEGLGSPDWQLALCLLFCWVCIAVVLLKGIRSSGKASYFLAIFPYVILLVLLIRTSTLEGAGAGISKLFTPQWEKLLEVKVWYAAVTQCFFSLTISLGAVIVFSSYNNFNNNIYRDAMIISWLDTFTSILSGIVVFGTVGSIAHVTKTKMEDMKLDGPELTFITYPDAIAKFDAAQNVFAVLFFLMFFLLGLGSNTGIVTTIVTAVRDRFPRIANWKVVIAVSLYGFACGLLYITPGGLLLLKVVDKYGVTLTTLTLVILEIITFCWIYGVERITTDIKFMLGRSTGFFWRICWSFLTLGIIFAIWLFSFIDFKPENVPFGYNAFGWCLFSFIMLQVVGWGLYEVSTQHERGFWRKVASATKPTADWGPEEATTRRLYQTEIATAARYKWTGKDFLKTAFCKFLPKTIVISGDTRNGA